MSKAIHRIHFIAIGGSVMHNLALSLHAAGYDVSGSDDEIYDPAASKLKAKGLLPDQMGWAPEKINDDIDAIILGMHAKPDNPELLKAQELGLEIFSYPAFIYEQARNKQRIVIAGSHGKTTVTAMMMHVLKGAGKPFDYVVGAPVRGFENTVKFSDDAIILLEGDEYLSSPIDNAPKFIHYRHHIGVITGIAWDHINVFPSLEEYVAQFDKFADNTPKGGSLIFNEEDNMATIIGNKEREDVKRIPYKTHPYEVKGDAVYLKTENGPVAVKVFGKHNMQNIAAAKALCGNLGITDKVFYEHIATFEGAKNRLELLLETEGTHVFRDYAHAPSKVKATVEAVKERYPKQALVACLELHTFSSLDKNFIKEYRDSLNKADETLVFINPNNQKLKEGGGFDEKEIREVFNNQNLKLFQDASALEDYIKTLDRKDKNLLMMSSGNFAGIDWPKVLA